MTTPADLSDLVRRLEVATVKIESFAASRSVSSIPSTTTTSTSVITGSLPPTASTSTTPVELNPAAQAFSDTIIDEALAEYTKLATSLGDLVKEQSTFIDTALRQTLHLIQLASNTKKPSDWPTGTIPQQVITPIRQAIENAVTLRDKNRTSKQFTHITAIADGIPAFGWIVVDPKPAPYISDLKDASQFYVNRVVKEFKDKPDGTLHVAWAQAWSKLLTVLLAYVKQWHTTGLIWCTKPNAVDLAVASANDQSSIRSVASSGTGVPPPPPSGPPPPPLPPASSSNSTGCNEGSGDTARHALFSQLNVGANITSTLKKVDPSQMTHKNPTLRAAASVPIPSTTKSAITTPTGNKPSISAPKQGSMSLQGQKWVIENFTGKRDIVITDTSIKTVVYVYGCTDCAVQVQGKVNSVTIDNCKKSGIVVDSAVSTVDIVNGKSIQLQINGSVPTIAVDNSDGTTLYLSEDALNAEILTAKASELNVMLPPATSGGDYRECPVPEQFKTTVDKANGILVTVPVEHKG